MSNINLLQGAVETAIIALDDWINIYAPEFCDADRVKQARRRLAEHGMLYYVATVVEQCRNSLGVTNDEDCNEDW